MRFFAWLLLVLGLALCQANPALGQPAAPPAGPVIDDPGKLRLHLDLGEHAGAIRAMFFSADGKNLITLSSDHTIRIIDALSGENRKVLYPPGFGGLSEESAMSPDGKLLAFSILYSEKETVVRAVCLMSIPDGRIVRVFKHHQLPTNPFSADGKHLVLNTFDAIWRKDLGSWTLIPHADKEFHIYALDNDRPGQERIVPNETPWQQNASWASLSPDGSRLAVPLDLKSLIALYDVKSGRRTNMQLKDQVFFSLARPSIAWSRDGQTLAALSAAALTLHEPNGKLRKSLDLKALKKTYRTMALSADEKTLIGVFSDPSAGGIRFGVYLVDTATLTERIVLVPPQVNGGFVLLSNAVLSPDGKLAAAFTHAYGDATRRIFVWQTSDGLLLPRFEVKSPLGSKARSPVDIKTSLWSADGKSVAWNLRNGAAERSFHLGELLMRPGLPLKDLRGGGLVDFRTGYKTVQGGSFLEQGDLSVTYEIVPVEKTIFKREVAKVMKGAAVQAEFQAQPLTLLGPDWVVARTKSSTLGLELLDARTGKHVRRWTIHGQRWDSFAPSPDGRFLLSMFSDRTMRIWSPAQDQPLLSLYFHNDDWIAWTEDGYYAATPGGERMMGWTLDNGIDKETSYFPAERFRKQLYRPDIIGRILEAGSVPEAVRPANVVRGFETRDVKVGGLLPPRVVLTVVDRGKLPTVKLKVQAEASAKEQPITALRLLLDGRPVPGKETLVEFAQGQAKAEVEWTFELPAGEHQLAVLARCPDSSAVSPPLRLKAVETAKLPTLHVLTVGVNAYKDSTLDLKYAAPDAEALAAAFAKHCKGQPFRDVRTRTLTNQQATRFGIVEAIGAMRKATQQQDLVVVFFACHGVKQKRDYFLLTHEADVAQLDKSSLSGDELRKSLSEFPCQVLLMLDACHSAGFGEGKKLAKVGLKPATDDVARDLTEDDCGIAVMCAAMSHEKAEGQGGHGLFTQALLEALEKKPGVPVPFNRHNQRVYVHHLQAYVFDEVSKRSEERQHPFLSLPWVVESFVIR